MEAAGCRLHGAGLDENRKLGAIPSEVLHMIPCRPRFSDVPVSIPGFVVFYRSPHVSQCDTGSSVPDVAWQGVSPRGTESALSNQAMGTEPDMFSVTWLD